MPYLGLLITDLFFVLPYWNWGASYTLSNIVHAFIQLMYPEDCDQALNIITTVNII